MHRRACQALLFLSLSLPHLVHAQSADGEATYTDNGDPKPTVTPSTPSSGVALTVVGAIALGIGALNFALIPVCSADFYPAEQKDTCVVASVTVGVIGVGVGLPLLLVGLHQRSQYKEWRKSHPVLAGLQFHMDQGRAEFGFRGSF